MQTLAVDRENDFDHEAKMKQMHFYHLKIYGFFFFSIFKIFQVDEAFGLLLRETNDLNNIKYSLTHFYSDDVN